MCAAGSGPGMHQCGELGFELEVIWPLALLTEMFMPWF